MTKYYLKTGGYEAHRVDFDSADEIAEWCGGESKQVTAGFTPKKRVRFKNGVDIWYADEGEWVAKITDDYFLVFNDDTMKTLFNMEAKKWRPIVRLPHWYSAPSFDDTPQDPRHIDVIATPVS